MGYAIGIDLGTTYTCAALLHQGNVHIVKNELGHCVTPSYVAFNELERIVGDFAKNNAHASNTDTIYDVKRFIGRKISDPIVQSDMQNWPFRLVTDSSKRPYVEVRANKHKTVNFAAEEISAMILNKMKQLAEKYLNETVTKAVITVPAYFNNSQRQATYDAAKIAGLEVLKLINEPTAAAIAYGFKSFEYIQPNTNLVVIDLGGGTFDVSVLTMGQQQMQVVASHGDTHLGGEDFNKNLIDYCIQKFKKICKKSIRKDQRAMNRLRTACEIAKIELSTAMDTDITIDGLCDGIDFEINITRARFEQLNMKEFKRILNPVRKTLKDAIMSKDEVHKIILVGGSTRIPMVQEIIQEYFAGKEIDTTIDVDQAIAFGAAVHAAILNDGGAAMGQAFQHILKDITPLSLGFGAERDCKLMKFVVRRNAMLPIEVNNECTTIHDNQTFIMFRIHQGEDNMADKNFLLGEFVLENIPVGPKGLVKVDVTFAIDENGILHVTAKERATGSFNGITVKDVTGCLTDKQISEMMARAQKYRDNESERKNAMLARTVLENELAMLSHDWLERDNKLLNVQKNQLKKKYEDALEWIRKNPRDNKDEYAIKLKQIRDITDIIVKGTPAKSSKSRESRRYTTLL